MSAGRYDPHPGWRHRVPAGRIVLVDQLTAATRVAELVDREDWRTDKRTTWTAVLTGLVDGMDWTSGLVTGVTRARLAARAGVGLRTVTSVLAWAQAVGLLVVVEPGASAAFLGTDRNRAPAYVLTVPVGHFPARSAPSVDESCHPPAYGVGKQPLGENQGRKSRQDQARSPSWPLWDRPVTAADRAAATATLLARVGLDEGRVPRWRAHALLTVWWRAEASVAGLLHALDHHPDRPAAGRGDALRAARDPLAVLGHRLVPWRGRLGELPAAVASVDGAERRRRAAVRDAANTEPPGRVVHRQTATPATRAAARAELDRALRRRWRHPHT